MIHDIFHSIFVVPTYELCVNLDMFLWQESFCDPVKFDALHTSHPFSYIPHSDYADPHWDPGYTVQRSLWDWNSTRDIKLLVRKVDSHTFQLGKITSSSPQSQGKYFVTNIGQTVIHPFIVDHSPGGYSPWKWVRRRAAPKTPFSRSLSSSLRPPFQHVSVL